MLNIVEYYCPVYEGKICEFDCDEISAGIFRGSFADDDIPFLMDLDTALSRKHRCLACEHCPERYRPRDWSAPHALRHLGYPQGNMEETQNEVLKTMAHHSAAHTFELQNRLGCCQLPSGIQLWFEWDPQQNLLVDVQPYFATANGMYMRIETLEKSNKYGQLTGSRVFAGLRHKNDQEKGLIHSAISAPNLNLFRDDYIQEGLVAQVCAFPEELACFDSVEDYKLRRSNRLAEESFVSGMSFDEMGRENMPGHCMLTGIVKSAEQIVNEVTGLPFYHLELGCLGMVFDVVTHPDLLPSAPKKDAVMQGVFRLSARVIDFYYTGYDFKITIETPLTLRRFETIRAALANMQPGERMSCDLYPALGEIDLLRVKREVEGMSVEFKVSDDDQNTRFLRFYPVSREESIKVFMRTLVYEDPPLLSDALDVTEEYQDDEDQPASDAGSTTVDADA